MERIGIWLAAGLQAALLMAGPNGLRLDEEGIRRAMRDEILERVRGIAEGRAAAVRDFRSLQAWEAVRGLVDRARSEGESLDQALFRLAEMPSGDPAALDFQGALSDFSRGMTIEIVDSLLFEYNQVDELLGRLFKLEELLAERSGELAEEPALRPLLRQRGIPLRLPGRARRMDDEWREPSGKATPFQRFSALKRNLTGSPAGSELETLFDLGQRHRDQSPFIEDFLAQYEDLGRRVRQTAARLRPRLAGPADVVQ